MKLELKEEEVKLIQDILSAMSFKVDDQSLLQASIANNILKKLNQSSEKETKE